MVRRSKKTARIEKPEEPRSFRIKLRPKLSLHIDVADDGERDKAVRSCAGSVPSSPPKNDPAKIPTRITDHRTGEVTDHPRPKESIPQGRAGGAEEQPSASPAKNWQAPTQEAINKSMARLREAMEATASPMDGKPAETIPPAEPVLTQAEIQALIKPDDESWFEAIDAVCEKIGIYGAFRWFLGAVGAGAGGATVVWAVNKLSQ